MRALSDSINPVGSVWEGDGEFIIAIMRLEGKSGWYEDDEIIAIVLNSKDWPEKAGSVYKLIPAGLHRNYTRIA